MAIFSVAFSRARIRPVQPRSHF